MKGSQAQDYNAGHATKSTEYIFFCLLYCTYPSSSDGKESACNAGNLGWEDPLEKTMATHSSILAWRIPRTMGS